MKDKISLLMRETGCEQGEAELALEMCGYDVEKAARAIPRLFRNIVVLKGKLKVEPETLYMLFLAVLDIKGRKPLRARAVASCNPAVFAVSLDQDWFGFEKHLYACRLRAGAAQSLSQEVERLLGGFFDSPEAAHFYSEAERDVRGRQAQTLREVLARRFAPHPIEIDVHKDVLDMGQFQEVRDSSSEGTASARERRRASAAEGRPGALAGAGPVPGTLVLRVALEGGLQGIPAGELQAGDFVYAHINDSRDIAQYLAKLLGERTEGASPLIVPVEAIETADEGDGAGREVCVRVRFSLGVCGDVCLPSDIRIKVLRKAEPSPWWKKLFQS